MASQTFNAFDRIWDSFYVYNYNIYIQKHSISFNIIQIYDNYKTNIQTPQHDVLFTYLYKNIIMHIIDLNNRITYYLYISYVKCLGYRYMYTLKPKIYKHYIYPLSISITYIQIKIYIPYNILPGSYLYTLLCVLLYIYTFTQNFFLFYFVHYRVLFSIRHKNIMNIHKHRFT